VLLGLPGSGKGTQAARLAAAFGVPALSTGEMLRCEVRDGTPIGQTVRHLIERGALVGDDLVGQILSTRLRHPSCQDGCVLDGYPRTIAQARFLDRFLRNRGFRLPAVVYLEVNKEEVIARLSTRLECPECRRTYSMTDCGSGLCTSDGARLIHRADDDHSVIDERFRLYEENTQPLLRYYAGTRLYRVAATGSPDQVFSRLMEAVGHRYESGSVRAEKRVPGKVILAPATAG
jgi:adenylate kinase